MSDAREAKTGKAYAERRFYESGEERRIHGSDGVRPTSERDQPSNRERGVRDTARSGPHQHYRSRSPLRERPKTRRESPLGSLSPDSHRSSHRGKREYSRRDRSVSRSRSRKRKRHNDEEDDRRRSHHHSHRNSYRRPASPSSRSRSPPVRPADSKRSKGPLPSQENAYRKDPTSDAIAKLPADVEKQKPNYAPTGKLAAETNTVANTNIVLKYNEPPEARLPPASAPWRLYVFKGKEVLETLPLHERSCWLFGRERAVVDFPTEHPSCSKQHAVLQFRYTEKKNEWGEKKGGVKPYLIDLESANGTKINEDKVPERRYMEVRSGDMITFGESTREYVIILPPKEEKKS